nr:helix-turn-helix domain-containing protein [uncultured Oscillibacter sp.]
MEKKVYKSYEELPLMLTLPDVASVLGVSRAGAYELAYSEGFPVLKVGSRIVIPKDKFLPWIEKQCGGES